MIMMFISLDGVEADKKPHEVEKGEKEVNKTLVIFLATPFLPFLIPLSYPLSLRPPSSSPWCFFYLRVAPPPTIYLRIFLPLLLLFWPSLALRSLLPHDSMKAEAAGAAVSCRRLPLAILYRLLFLLTAFHEPFRKLSSGLSHRSRSKNMGFR